VLQTYQATGTSKRQTKNDLADKVVAEILPQIEDRQRRRVTAQAEMEKARREYTQTQDRQRKMKSGYDGGDSRGGDSNRNGGGGGHMLCEDEKINNFMLRPKNSLQVSDRLLII